MPPIFAILIMASIEDELDLLKCYFDEPRSEYTSKQKGLILLGLLVFESLMSSGRNSGIAAPPLSS